MSNDRFDGLVSIPFMNLYFFLNSSFWYNYVTPPAAETKAIINMDDLLKRCTIKLELSVAENEDLTSKLQVRISIYLLWKQNEQLIFICYDTIFNSTSPNFSVLP